MMMGNERYTSPTVSRALAEAGIDQMHENFEDVRAQWFDYGGGLRLVPGYAGGSGYRALDLTDVLHEIETRGATWLVETDGDTYCMTAVLNPTFSAVMGGPSAAEAAGLCLLALMDKLREVKP